MDDTDFFVIYYATLAALDPCQQKDIAYIKDNAMPNSEVGKVNIHKLSMYYHY